MVYVINIKGTSLYKIGISINVEDRFKQLDTTIPYDLILVNTYKVNHDKTVEFSLHKHFKDKRIKAEWFNLSEKDMVELDRYVLIYDIKKYDRVKMVTKRDPKFDNVTELVDKIFKLEKKYKGTKGIGDSRAVIGNELKISDGTISKLKKIHKFEPSLLDEIDRGNITLRSAYFIVQNNIRDNCPR
jgi:hypothetical protein